LEVAKNGAIQLASSRGKADCFILSSVAGSSSDREQGSFCSHKLSKMLLFCTVLSLKILMQLRCGAVWSSPGQAHSQGQLRLTALGQLAYAGVGQICPRGCALGWAVGLSSGSYIKIFKEKTAQNNNIFDRVGEKFLI